MQNILQPAEESTTVCFSSRKQPLILQTASQKKKSDFTEGKKVEMICFTDIFKINLLFGLSMCVGLFLSEENTIDWFLLLFASFSQ